MIGRRVKIVCTLGPATPTKRDLAALVRAGMDVARLNFSHGSHREHARTIRLLREVERDAGRPIAILADLAGPKIRLGEVREGPRMVRRGAEVVLSSRLRPGGERIIGTTYRHLARDLRRGDAVLLDDGRVRLEVRRVAGHQVRCAVREGGEISSHKGINLPGARLTAPALTAKDRDDLRFALRQGADLVALSFVRRPEDIRRAAALLRRLSSGGRRPAGQRRGLPFAGPHPPLIAKLEKPEALEHLGGILARAEGVMVARGDLGVEIPPERVPVAQKRIIARANGLGRPVITATQMLESMTEHRRPTRAEASDVANAVLDGTDAVMLSAETATGRYPAEAVRMMDRIIRETEAGVQRGVPAPWRPAVDDGAGEVRLSEDAVARAAVTLAESLRAAAIVAFTISGSTAIRLARLRPLTPVLALTPEGRVARRLALVWGVESRLVGVATRVRALTAAADRAVRGLRLARSGQSVILALGYPIGPAGRTNLLKVHRVGERD